MNASSGEHPTENDFFVFLGFFREAFLSAFRNAGAILFALLSVLFGTDSITLLDKGMPLESFAETMTSYLQNHPWTALLIIPSAFLSVIFRSCVILTLSEKNVRVLHTLHKSVHAFVRLFVLECLAIFSMIFFGFILLFPSTLAAEGGTIQNILAGFGTLILIVLSVILLFSMIYSSLYILLSDVSLRSGMTLGYTLFQRKASSSLGFGAISIAVSLLFSLLLSTYVIVMQSFVPGASGTEGRFLTAGSVIIFFTLLSKVQNHAWLSFFRRIVKPKSPEVVEETSQEEDIMIQREIRGTEQI
ncbi:MAG: hypothetical protein WCL23_04165 [Candidatus Moraniibacteriota bacterium]